MLLCSSSLSFACRAHALPNVLLLGAEDWDEAAARLAKHFPSKKGAKAADRDVSELCAWLQSDAGRSSAKNDRKGRINNVLHAHSLETFQEEFAAQLLPLKQQFDKPMLEKIEADVFHGRYVPGSGMSKKQRCANDQNEENDGDEAETVDEDEDADVDDKVARRSSRKKRAAAAANDSKEDGGDDGDNDDDGDDDNANATKGKKSRKAQSKTSAAGKDDDSDDSAPPTPPRNVPSKPIR